MFVIYVLIFFSHFLQIYGSQILLQREHAIPVRHFAKESAPALKGDREFCYTVV